MRRDTALLLGVSMDQHPLFADLQVVAGGASDDDLFAGALADFADQWLKKSLSPVWAEFLRECQRAACEQLGEPSVRLLSHARQG